MSVDPAGPWIGGYVGYQWARLPPLLEAYGIRVARRRVLEFGSDTGASAIVYRLLGAEVHAVDVADNLVRLAVHNIRRHGLDDVSVLRVRDGTRLPFVSASFDVISCNSVLEYVPPKDLTRVQRELDRVLKPGGILLVTATSSRLWPREVHSGAWLVNYVPRAVDALLRTASRPTRGVWPWTIRNGFGPGYRNLDAGDGGRAFLAARAAMRPRADSAAHRLLARLAALAGIGPGLLMNNISCVLRKPE